MNTESIVAHIRANAQAIALMSINSEITHSAVCDFCSVVEALLVKTLPVETEELKKEKAVGSHNLHRSGR